MFRVLVLIIAAQFTQAAYALTQEETTITVYQAKSAPKVIDVAKLPLEELLSRTPHRALNPEKKLIKFQGVELSDVIKLSKIDDNTKITIVGVDGYMSTVPAAIFKKTHSVLTLSENGAPLEQRRGGLQLVYDTESAVAVPKPYAEKAAFWCWYIKSIVIGDVAAVGLKADKATTKKFGQSVAVTPPSVFQFDQVNCPKLSRVPANKVLKHSGAVNLTLLTGKTQTITPAEYDALISDQGPSPAYCGGPMMLVKAQAKAADGKSFRPNELILGVAKVE